MRRFLLVASACALCHGAFADMLGPPPASLNKAVVPSVVAPSYTGPLDVVASATACFSLKACSAAIAAAGTQKLINIERIVDGHKCDVIVATSGNIGLTANCTTGGDNGSTVAAFQTVDASATGAITGTALTMVGGHVGDAVTGGTTLAGTFIITGTAPNWTVNQTQTVASATLTLLNALWVHTWYDQSGNGRDAPEGGAQAQSYLLPNADPAGAGYAVAIFPVGGSASGFSATIGALSQPYSLSAVAYQIPGSNEGFAMSGYNASSGAGVLGFNDGNVANKAELYCGSRIDVTTATDGVWHAMQGVCNGASSELSIDSITPTIANAGAGATSTTMGLGSPSGGTFGQSGFLVEAVTYPIGFTSGNISSMNANQHTRWGF